MIEKLFLLECIFFNFSSNIIQSHLINYIFKNHLFFYPKLNFLILVYINMLNILNSLKRCFLKTKSVYLKRKRIRSSL